MTLLDPGLWTGRVFTGEWATGSGDPYDVVEPASGDTLGLIGSATAADVHKAAERAAQAQRDWAARPYAERAAVRSDLPTYPF
jgi:benzaldehyde dehydrogenase (NAD)